MTLFMHALDPSQLGLDGFIINSRKRLNKLVVGDFNFRDIDWDLCSTLQEISVSAWKTTYSACREKPYPEEKNILNQYVKHASSIDSFKKNLKTFLIKTALICCDH